MRKFLLAVALLTIPGPASSQALLSDQRDALAHLTNTAIAAELCSMQISRQQLEAALTHVGLSTAELEMEPFRGALAEVTVEARLWAAKADRKRLCDRLEAMYGPSGQRIPGLVRR